MPIETPYLTPLLKKDRPIWIMGVHDVLSAKIAERAGYDALGVQSLQVAFANGQPDIGVITPDETLEVCRKIRRSSNLPLVVDFEQPFTRHQGPHGRLARERLVRDAGHAAREDFVRFGPFYFSCELAG